MFERDAIGLGIDLRKLRKNKNCATGIGGSADACYVENIKLGFLGDDGKVWVASYDAIPIIVPKINPLRRILEFFRVLLLGKPEIENTKGLPSLLGFDFLRKCTISFSEKEAYLHVD